MRIRDRSHEGPPSDTSTSGQVENSHRVAKVFVTAYLMVFAVAAAWSLATPLFASPDEPDQVIKAVAVAHGQFLGTPVTSTLSPRTYVTVPASFVSGLHLAGCFVGRRNVTPGCAPPLSIATEPLRVSIYVGRYPPLYYAIVGIPSWFSSTSGAVFAMRLVSAGVNALFLALALTVAWVWGRRKIAVVGVLLAGTPQVLFLAGVVNANSLEISAAICLWTAASCLALDEATPPPTALVVITTAAATTEVLCRALSPLWVACALVVAAALAGRRRVGVLARCRSFQVGGLALLAATLLAGAWTVHFHATEVQSVQGAAAHAITGSYEHALLGRQALYFHETIGRFGTENIASPGLTYRFWAIGVIAFGITALVVAGWRRRATFVVLVVAGFAIPFGIILSQAASHHGLIWQGRDGAPLTLGIPIVAGILIAAHPRLERIDTGISSGIALLAGVGGIGSFAGMENRYAVGFDHPFDFFADAAWHPMLGALALLIVVACLVSAGVITVVVSMVRERPRTVASHAEGHIGVSGP